MEVTRSIRLFRLNCAECEALVMVALAPLDGVLVSRLIGDELVVTYDDSRVRFHEIVNSLLSMGFGAYLRRLVLALNKHPVGDLREWGRFEEALREYLDGLVSVEYDAVVRRLILTIDPGINESEVAGALRRLGIVQFRVTSDEVAQVTLSMS